MIERAGKELLPYLEEWRRALPPSRPSGFRIGWLLQQEIRDAIEIRRLLKQATFDEVELHHPVI